MPHSLTKPIHLGVFWSEISKTLAESAQSRGEAAPAGSEQAASERAAPPPDKSPRSADPKGKKEGARTGGGEEAPFLDRQTSSSRLEAQQTGAEEPRAAPKGLSGAHPEAKQSRG